MISEYSEEDLLPISGLQHFLFCRRQWALIHIERAWAENHLTVEGREVHEKVDNPFQNEIREGVIRSRHLPVVSYRLGIWGFCDLVEFSPDPAGISIKDRAGSYIPTPVEYKKGREKQDFSDESQLCAQAMCLEEMMSISISVGYLYYAETHHRVAVDLNSERRKLVEDSAREMHNYFERGYTPQSKPGKKCQSCSLADFCLPQLIKQKRSGLEYIAETIQSEKRL